VFCNTITGKATEEIRARLATLTAEMNAIKAAMGDSTESVMRGESAVKSAQGRIAHIGERMSGLNGRMTELAAVLTEQRSATTDISAHVGKIAEKAGKTRTEIGGSLGRLFKAECGALAGVEDFAGDNIPTYGLQRARVGLMIGLRKLAAMFVGLDQAVAGVLNDEYRRLCEWCDAIAHSGVLDRGAVADVRAAAGAADTAARRCTEAVRTGNHALATEAYVAAENAVTLFEQHADKLLRIIDASPLPGPAFATAH
jgi:methyl-accepting chemotaxis protein